MSLGWDLILPTSASCLRLQDHVNPMPGFVLCIDRCVYYIRKYNTNDHWSIKQLREKWWRFGQITIIIIHSSVVLVCQFGFCICALHDPTEALSCHLLAIPGMEIIRKSIKKE